MLAILAALFLPMQAIPGPSQGGPYAPPAHTQERLARAAYLAEHAFDLADQDHDGRLSRDEYRAKEWLVYRDYDHNSDGAVDRAEFDDMRCGGYAPDRPGENPQRAWCIQSAGRDFRRLARSGAITPRSLQREADSGFSFNDINRDGFVTQGERLTAARWAHGR